MKARPTALIAMLALGISSAAALPALANESLLVMLGQPSGFLLPINGRLVMGRSLLEEAEPPIRILPPKRQSGSGEPDRQMADPASQPAEGKSLLHGQSSWKGPVSPLPALSPSENQSIQPANPVLVIDDDLESATPVEENFQWQELPDQQGRTSIQAGARFPVAVLTQISSKTAQAGDPVEAQLKVDLKIGGRLIAKKGSRVTGHVASAKRARRMLQAELSPKRWMRASGSLGLQFDEIITDVGEHLPLVAKPARQSRIVKNKGEGRVLGVNHNGEVASPLSIQLKHQALHLAIRGAASAGGVFSFGIVPVAYGVVGAINPSFAFLHPVGTNVPHRRLKGFAMGVVSGLPGGFLIADTIIRGQEAVIKPGDEFLAEFQQEFTGEAATDAQLIPGATTRVRGQVLPADQGKTTGVTP